MEHIIIETIHRHDGYALIDLDNIPVGQDFIVQLLNTLAEHDINVNQMHQITNLQGMIQTQMTVISDHVPAVLQLLDQIDKTTVPALQFHVRDNISRIVLIGSGIRTYSALVAEVFSELERNDVTVAMISTSEMSLAIYVERDLAQQTIELLETRFAQNEHC